MKPLYDEFIEELGNEINFEYKIGKTYIGSIKTLVFAAIRVQNEKIIFEFTSRQKLASSRFSQVKHLQKERWAYFLDIQDLRDVDKELIS